MIDVDKYSHIVEDWLKNKNIKQGIELVMSDSLLINQETLKLLQLNKFDDNDIKSAEIILLLSNILYNNTSMNVLLLEDGIYDLLIVKYKNETGKDIVGAPPIQFGDIDIDKPEQNLIPGVSYMTEDENNFIDSMIYHKDIYRNKVLTPADMLVPGVSYERTVTKRLRDTSHNHPELVGTLDKAKFVLVSQAKKKGVDTDPKVKILERDFFGKHINEYFILDPSWTIRVIAELKYDGVSIEADIQNKRIISARTRGDTANDIASDLTPILEGYYFPNAPETDEIFGVKFEAIMTYGNLERYSAMKNKKFANGRTAVISWTTSSDAYQYKELITLVPLATDIKDEWGKPINIYDRLVEVELMNRLFCRDQLLRYSVFEGDLTTVLFEIYKFAQEAEFMRRVLPFMYDGIVVSYLDAELRATLGRKNSINQYSMAVKFNTLVRETRFTGYEFTIGQNGEITPMIYYNPVEFFGTIHPKSSGHSYGNFKNLALRLNDIIEVEYRNDVITYVYRKKCIENDNNQNPVIQFPRDCPCCGTPLEFTDLSAKCPNFECKERAIKRMANMIDKLQLSGFAEETVRALNVFSFHELMELKLEDISHIGDLTSNSLINQLDMLRNGNLYDYKLIGALGFSDLAMETWKSIFNTITLEQLDTLLFMYYSNQDDYIKIILKGIKGIGNATVNTILKEYKYFVNDIHYIITNIKYKNSLGVKQTKVRFTGIRNKELVDALNNMGYDAGEGSVTKDTDILIVPYEGYNSGNKYKKAIDYGVRIVPIQELIEQLKLDISI